MNFTNGIPRRLAVAAAVAGLLISAALTAPQALARNSDGKGKPAPAANAGDDQAQTKAKAKAKPRPATKSSAKSQARPKSKVQSKAKTKSAPKAKAKQGGHNPPGNNGTFKVDGLPYDDGHDNEPHVTCEFRLVFWGFDQDQRGTINIDGHAPSGEGRVGGLTDVLLSDDEAGGGNDLDAIFIFTLADLDLSGLTLHPQQGYHLKVTVLTGEPGGKKHKVFWFQPCETTTTPTPTPTPTVSPTETTTPTPTPTVSPTETTTPSPTGTVSPTDTASPTPTVGGVVTTRPPGGGPGVGPGATPGTRVLGRKQTRETGVGGLAFGGFEGLTLALAGVALIAAGVVMFTAARRRREYGGPDA